MEDAQRVEQEIAEARRDADEERQDAEKWALHTQEAHTLHRQWTVTHRYRSGAGELLWREGEVVGSATTYHILLPVPAEDGSGRSYCFYRVVEAFKYRRDHVQIPFIPSMCETRTRQLARDIKVLCESKPDEKQQETVGGKESLEEIERRRRRELKGKDRAFE